MGILSKAELSNYSNRLPYHRSATVLFQGARINSRDKYDSSVFLSHSHLDSEYVKDIVAILRSMGVNCYVDWMDDSMPEKTSGITAAKIKEKIKSNDKFVFLATNNSIASKWCNWEIGYGDAQKYMDKIAVFPLKDNYGEWKGNEYLQIYPYIFQSDNYKDIFLVKEPTGHVLSLMEWLKR